MGDIKSGNQFGQLALNLLEQFNGREIKAKTEFIAHGLIKHWLEPASKTLNLLQSAYVFGLETRDLEYATYSSLFYCFQAFLAGNELTQLQVEMESHSEIMLQFGQERSLSMLKPFYHEINALLSVW